MSPRTLTLTEFEPVTFYNEMEQSDHLRGAFIDVETTGTDTATAKIIQLAIVPFTFSKDGKIGAVHKPYIGFEDPGIPIPPEVTKLTGITDEMVKGQKLSFAQIGAATQDAVLIVAHKADFDRPIAERQFSLFEEFCWACTIDDVPWKDEGYTSAKLEWLAFKHCGMFFDAHRADLDCMFGVHLLSTTLPSGKRVMEAVLENARTSWNRIAAVGAPFDFKDALKARGYRWNADNRVWWTDVKASDGQTQTELAWLKENVPCNPRQTTFDAYTRFSNRIGQTARRRATA